MICASLRLSDEEEWRRYEEQVARNDAQEAGQQSLHY